MARKTNRRGRPMMAIRFETTPDMHGIPGCNSITLVRTSQFAASSRTSMAWPIDPSIRSGHRSRRFRPGMNAACPTRSSPTIRQAGGAVCSRAERYGLPGHGGAGLQRHCGGDPVAATALAAGNVSVRDRRATFARGAGAIAPRNCCLTSTRLIRGRFRLR
jgi:hypothetical protein